MFSRTVAVVNAVPGYVGRRTIHAVFYLIDLTVFTLRAIEEWRSRFSLFNRATWRSTIAQIIFTGVDAIPSVTILALIAGISITAQLIFVVQVFGSETDVVTVITRLVALEMGSLLTAIVVIGRSGSAIVVDLGTMKLNREIEGLELLGINVNDFFITPRLVGAAVAQVALAVYFSTIAVVSGIGFMALLESFGYLRYLEAVPAAIPPGGIALFLAKNLLFGLIIGATACFHAFKIESSITEVPQETQRAIVNSLTIVFLVDGLLVLATL